MSTHSKQTAFRFTRLGDEHITLEADLEYIAMQTTHLHTDSGRNSPLLSFAVAVDQGKELLIVTLTRALFEAMGPEVTRLVNEAEVPGQRLVEITPSPDERFPMHTLATTDAAFREIKKAEIGSPVPEMRPPAPIVEEDIDPEKLNVTELNKAIVRRLRDIDNDRLTMAHKTTDNLKHIDRLCTLQRKLLGGPH